MSVVVADARVLDSEGIVDCVLTGSLSFSGEGTEEQADSKSARIKEKIIVVCFFIVITTFQMQLYSIY